MSAAGLGFWAASTGVAMAAGPTSSTSDGTTTVSFTGQGCTTWTVPAGVSAVQILATGAAGSAGSAIGSALGGAGGLGDGVSGSLSGLAGGTQALDVCVDQGGGRGGPHNFGGASGGDGGGASGVGLGSDFSAPVLVAGGGGGGGAGFDTFGNGGAGGSAGTPVAAAGSPSFVGSGQGGGGDNTAQTGGSGGVSANPACNGTSGGPSGPAGPGTGGDGVTTVCGNGGGGGGAGYFGGGAAASFGASAPGGGGGTDFCADAVAECTVTSGAGTGAAAGSAPGDAQVVLTYVEPDVTAPTDAPVATPAANANGWNNTDVAIAWNWTDSGSGIDPASCTQSSSSSGEGVQSVSASCADLAGNPASDSVRVEVDKTLPVDDPVVTTTATGASVAWNWSDALSGVDGSTCTQSSSQTGTGQLTLTSTCADLAGNVATDSETVTVSPPTKRADLQVKLTGPATGRKNTGYTYQVTTKNAGPSKAADVVSTLLLPRNATLVSFNGPLVRVGALLTWTTPNLASGASVSYTVKVKFPSNAAWTLGAAAASLPTRTVHATPDPNLLNNVAAVTTRIS